ncbi:ferredoxin [Nocardia brasiliensis]|uniref:Ferredoxin n=1 Tax=Nocardia brasiliensis TaxID=37326 RepID=A0A6G9XV28_NOCBR|nr:ferredoxin [Nocardia brasiliensis]QIS04683.1 ferredoxin [Nocardia brasiliensis]
MTEQKWQIEVDREQCLGSGMCVGMAPEHFTLVDGRSRPIAEIVAPDEFVVDAAESCPIEAIRVRDADTGAIIAPGP